MIEVYVLPSSCSPGELAVCVAAGEPAVWATDVPCVAEDLCPLTPINGGTEDVALPTTDVAVPVEVGDVDAGELPAVVDCGDGLSASPIRFWSASKTA